jgi:hypothetical protein
VVIIVVLIAIAVVKRRKRQERSDRLRERFGPEYDRTVERAKSRSEAEDQLEARAARREKMRLRSLDPDERRSFVSRWEDLQASFVDGPGSAVRGGDVLLDDVALARVATRTPRRTSGSTISRWTTPTRCTSTARRTAVAAGTRTDTGGRSSRRVACSRR